MLCILEKFKVEVETEEAIIGVLPETNMDMVMPDVWSGCCHRHGEAPVNGCQSVALGWSRGWRYVGLLLKTALGRLLL